MEYNDIRNLIDRYLDGETSLSEERAIAQYFATAKELPADLQPIKVMFETMAAMRNVTPNSEVKPREAIDLTPKHATTKTSVKRWVSLTAGISIAACMVLGVFTMLNHETNTDTHAVPTMVCYINGEQINDMDQAYSETNRILNNVASNVELAMARVDEIKILSIR